MLLLLSLWFGASLVRRSKGEYTYLYGGIVAQTIQNASENNEDVSEAVAFALRQAKLEEEDCRTTYIEKQRLYFSTNNQTPLQKNDFHDGLSRNGHHSKPSFQKREHVLGLMYSFLVVCHGSNPVCPDTEEEHHLVVTRDRNKDYHFFRKTSKQTSRLLTCRKVDLRGLLSSSYYPANILSKLTNLHSDETLKIASYNVWNVNKLENKGETYKRRMERLGKLIDSLYLDVIGFQEVRLEVGTKGGQETGESKSKVSTVSQNTFLAKKLQGYQFVFQPAMLYMEQPLERKEEGLAVFSRYPIVSSDYRLLSRNRSDSDDYHQRICLHAEILTPHFGTIHVFVSHLSLSTSSQERTVLEIWKYMQEFSGLKLLLGDLNAEPNSTAMRFLRGELPLSGVRTKGLVDLWQLQENGTDSEDNGFTFNALDDELVKRIDYIFATFPYDQHIEVTATSVTVDNHICYLPCSDHHILWTALTSRYRQCSI